MLAAITEAVRDRDQRSLRRLLARFAEQVTITDLHTLRDALDPRQSRRSGPRSRGTAEVSAQPWNWRRAQRQLHHESRPSG